MASTIEAFRGTKHEKTFRIYHDALSQLTAEDTKAWLKTKTHEGRTWFDIWITPVLDLNKDTAYEGRPRPSCNRWTARCSLIWGTTCRGTCA